MALDTSLLRTAEFPTIWCPGCGHGVITQAVVRACNEMGWEQDEVFAVSGIGCSARTPAYLDYNSVQTTHGRAIAFATGMKMAAPEKHVFLVLGDGDCASIGGNHLLHACRKNMDLTVIVMNNNIYGMTGGQTSPTTPLGSRTTTNVYGTIDDPIDISAVAIAAGATYVARSTAFHAAQLPGLIKKGFENRGMSVIEILDPCPTGYGGRNGYRHVREMYEHLRDIAVPVERWNQMTEEERQGKISTGVLCCRPRESYLERYDRMTAGITKVEELADLSGKRYDCPPMERERYELRLSGSGGQGLLMSGVILSEAMVRQGKRAVQTQSYGVAARGGASRSEVVVSDSDIHYYDVTEPDLVLCMSQESWGQFASTVKPGGVLLADSTYIKDAASPPGARTYAFPITESAVETFGEVKCANIIALGIIAACVPWMSPEAMLDAALCHLPEKTHGLNRRAFSFGLEQGRLLAGEGAETR